VSLPEEYELTDDEINAVIIFTNNSKASEDRPKIRATRLLKIGKNKNISK
jgi:hypothetical protein